MSKLAAPGTRQGNTPSFRRPVLQGMAALVVLLGLERFHPEARSWPAPPVLGEVIRSMCKRGQNREDSEGMTAGYYEGLLNESQRVTLTGSLITNRLAADRAWQGALTIGTAHQMTQDFLYYRLRPDLDLAENVGRLITNRFGMCDGPYELRKPPGTYRVALIGDSLLRGMGAPFGTSFEARLERRLQEIDRPDSIEKYELLNFGVEGYRITQLLEVALTQVPPFSPDAYVLALSDVSVFRAWGNHLGRLVRDGIDLKYDFLNDVARRARLDPTDDMETFAAKLAPFREEVLRQILGRIQAQARRDQAAFCVLLVPTVTDTQVLTDRFARIRELLGELDVPCVDLLATFAGQTELSDLRVSSHDHHPNARGHEMLCDALFEQLQARPVLWKIWTGQDKP